MATKQDLLKAAKMLGIEGVNTKSTVDELNTAINAKLGNPDLENDDQNAEKTAS